MANNIFIDGEISQINYQNPQHLKHENVKTLRNIICYTKFDSELFRISGERSVPVESDYNVYFCAENGGMEGDVIRGLPEVNTFEEWQKHGFDTHSIVGNPLFVDAANDDYSLKPDSPAFKLGFKPIDISKVGLKGKD
jgi:hypothetical protein